MVLLKEITGTLKKLINNGIDTGKVLICFRFKKKGGARLGKSAMLAIVVSVEDDHIMVSPRGSPERIISIDGNTNVSRLDAGTVSLTY